MGLGTSVGQDLGSVPFAEMVLNLGLAIATAQTALDTNSINTAKQLSQTYFDVLTEIVDVINPVPSSVVTAAGSTVFYTGATVSSAFYTKNMSLIQAGLFPSFYVFAGTIIEVKMAISAKTSSEFSLGVKASGGFACFSVSVDAKYSQSFSYSVEGSSLLRTTLNAVPAPQRLHPRTITVDALQQPPQVTII